MNLVIFFPWYHRQAGGFFMLISIQVLFSCTDLSLRGRATLVAEQVTFQSCALYDKPVIGSGIGPLTCGIWHYLKAVYVCLTSFNHKWPQLRTTVLKYTAVYRQSRPSMCSRARWTRNMQIHFCIFFLYNTDSCFGLSQRDSSPKIEILTPMSTEALVTCSDPLFFFSKAF